MTASQDGKAILILSSSFQVDEAGFDHQIAMPVVPPPEAVPLAVTSTRPVPELIPTSSEHLVAHEFAIEMRPVEPVDSQFPDRKEPFQHIWFRAAGPVPGNAALQKCLLAYASDFSLRAPATPWENLLPAEMVTASLDTPWFYRDFRMDDWHLYVCDSPSAGHARGLNASIFSHDGRLRHPSQEGPIHSTQFAERDVFREASQCRAPLANGVMRCP